jgi:hypothetical protein
MKGMESRELTIQQSALAAAPWGVNFRRTPQLWRQYFVRLAPPCGPADPAPGRQNLARRRGVVSQLLEVG